jgi:hypothetical protein
VCSVGEKLIFENYESNQWLADYDNANFGLAGIARIAAAHRADPANGSDTSGEG